MENYIAKFVSQTNFFDQRMLIFRVAAWRWSAICKEMVTSGWCAWATSHCDAHHKRIIV